MAAASRDLRADNAPAGAAEAAAASLPARGSPYGRARLFLVNMAAAAVMITVAHLLRIGLSAPALAFGYGLLIVAERRQGVLSPLSVALALTGVALMATAPLLEPQGWDLLAPMAVFGVLFAVGVTCLALGRPMTTFIASAGLGTPALHWMTSGLWTAVYGLGLLFAWLTPTRPLLLFAAPLLIWLAVAATLYLHLVDMGPAFRRPRSFTGGRFRWREGDQPEDIQAFYWNFMREAMPSVKAGNGPRTATHEEMVTRRMELDRDQWPRTRFFLATMGEDVVGTIACIDDDPRTPFPAEVNHEQPFSLDGLRRHGRIVEFGRFSIAKQHRFGQELISGLFRCVIERAMECDAAFVVALAYEPAWPIYRKIGFVPLTERPVHQRATGVAAYPAVLNLSRKVVLAKDGERRLVEGMGTYIPERYMKRCALKQILRRRPAWTLSDEEMKSVILAIRPENRQ